MEVNEYTKHYFLYAKGWYKKTNLIEDLAQIHANRYYVPSDCITEWDLFSGIFDIVSYLIKGSSKGHEVELECFIRDLSPDNYWKLSDKEYNFIESFLRSALSLMRYKTIDNLDPERDCDYDILPRKEE